MSSEDRPSLAERQRVLAEQAPPLTDEQIVLLRHLLDVRPTADAA